MVLAFVGTVQRTPREQIDALTWDALRALGELTKLANAASTTEDALLVHDRADHIRAAVLGLIGVALNKADQNCGVQA